MLIPKSKKWYGWQPDLPDYRDFQYMKVGKPIIPQDVDLRKTCKTPDVFNQDSLGACTGNGISWALGFDILNNHCENPFTEQLPLSRLFIYYNERVIENSVNSDSGAQIRDGLKSVASVGVCVELLHPYEINRFTEKPSDAAYQNALKYKAIEYRRLNNANKLDLISCLMDGYPFVLGFSVYSGFESQEVYDTGVVNMPKPNESLLGGHCVVGVGYILAEDRFICVNSWGADWGQDGYFTIPADYLCNWNLASDFWVIRTML